MIDPIAPPYRPRPTIVETRAIAQSLAVSVTLSLIKLVAYIFTGSNVVFSDAMEGIVNVLAAGFALYAITLAHRPADSDHPYGHGKIEFFSAGFEGGMILLAVLLIILRSAYALAHRSAIEHLDIGLYLMVGAMAVNGWFGLRLMHAGRRQSSMTLEADGKHLLSDAITSAVAAAALVVVRVTGWQIIDPIAAIAVALYIAWMALGIVRQSAAGLMDRQDHGDTKLLENLLDSHVGPAGKEPRICSYHKLRHRHSGRYHWVDFHIMLPPWWDIERAHDTASKIEYEIELALREGNATAHIEPCENDGCPLCEQQEQHKPHDDREETQASPEYQEEE